MPHIRMMMLAAIAFLLTGCIHTEVNVAKFPRSVSGQELEESKARYESAREALYTKMPKVVNATREVIQPLKTLSEEQLAAVTSALVLSNTLSGRRSKDQVAADELEITFVNALRRVAPILGTYLDLTPQLGACLDESIGYVSALASCQEEGKREEECPEAWEAGAQEIICRTKLLEKMGDILNHIYGGLQPPRPQPWPLQ